MHNNKTYAVINLTDISLIDFSQIGESSVSTIRKSLDDTQFVIKWEEGYIPTFISDGTVTVIPSLLNVANASLSRSPLLSINKSL